MAGEPIDQKVRFTIDTRSQEDLRKAIKQMQLDAQSIGLEERRSRTLGADKDTLRALKLEKIDRQRQALAIKEVLNQQGKQVQNMSKVNDLYSKYRKSITGVLIDLHMLRIVGQSSRVVNRSFEALSKSLGHLVDVILVPMLPVFMIFVQGIQQVAGIILKMPAPLRMAISAIATFAISLMATASLMKMLIGVTPWAKAPVKRAAGGPLSYGQAAIVGERGPELLLPTGGGYHVVPNGQLRFLAEGTEGSTGFLTNLTSGLTGLAGDTAAGTAGLMSSLVQNKSTQNLLASAGIIGGTLGAIMAPLSGMMGIGGVMAGGFMGVIKAVKGSGQATVGSIVGAASSLRNILTLLLIATTKAGVGAAVGTFATGGTLGVWEILQKIWDDLKVVYGYLKELYNEYIQPVIDWLKEKWAGVVGWYEENIAPKIAALQEKFGVLWDFLGNLKDTILNWLGLTDLAGREWDFLGWIKETILNFLGFGKTSDESMRMIKENIKTALMGFVPGGILQQGWSVFSGQTGYYSAREIGAASGLDVPSFASGGVMDHTGFAYLHAGETVVPPGGGNVTVNITVNGNMDDRAKQELIRELKLALTRVR